MSAPPGGDVENGTGGYGTGGGGTGREQALRAWLARVDSVSGPAVSADSLRGRVTMPLRAVRRFRVLVSELGPSQAVAVSAEYVGRRLRRSA